MLFTLAEEPNYARQAEQIGDIQRLDEALSGLHWALANNPEAFDIVIPSDPPIYLAKTDRRSWSGGVIPRLRIWFRIAYENRKVVLLAIQQESIEDIT